MRLLTAGVVAALVVWAVRPATAPRDLGDVRRPHLAKGRRGIRLAAVVATLVVTVAAPVLGASIAITIGVRLARRGSAEARRRARDIERTLPATIDLIAMMVSSGLTARRAIGMAVPRFPSPHRQAWAAVLSRADAGEPFPDALAVLVYELGEPIRPLTVALLASERDGVALTPALARCSDEAHRRRRVRAEEAARRVPVLMLFPLVCCVLPAFGLLTIVPLLAGTISDLQLPG